MRDTCTSEWLKSTAAAVRSHLWQLVLLDSVRHDVSTHVPEGLRLVHQPDIFAVDAPGHLLL